ncbi:hypothetical protein BJX96DRAFT_175060 [Aspergillus floccosus]
MSVLQPDIERPAHTEKPAPESMPWHPSQYPDGGLQAWLVVAGAFCCVFCRFGWINCIGVFQSYYETHQLQQYSSSEISWIASLELFILFWGGPVIGRIYDRQGPHPAGLHRDPAAFGLRPLESELRRRLWWFIVGLDQRPSEYHGYEPIVSESSFDTRLPLNINDSDLTADMVQPPTERYGPTEMTLSLIAWEAISIVGKVSSLARTVTRLETRYLQHCDPGEPFLFVSATVAKLIIARVWLIALNPRKQADSSKEVTPAPPQASPQDMVFLLSIEILELSCSLLCDPRIALWAWRSDTYLQWHAVALVLSEICTRPPCRDCDRAWAVVETLYDRWRMKELTRKGTLWKPIGWLMAKARYVREMQSVDRGCSVGGSSSVMGASPNAPLVAPHVNVTTTLDPLADIFSLAPFMEVSPGLDDLFPEDDDFVQVGLRPGF